MVHNALKNYRFKVYDPPEITIQKNTYKIVDAQIENRKKNLDFSKSWEQFIVANDEEMKEYVKLKNQKDEDDESASIKEAPKDGKDWSLSTDEFDIYVAGENKDVVNRDAWKEEIFKPKLVNF